MKTTVLPLALLLALMTGCASMAKESAPEVLSAKTANKLYGRQWDLTELVVDGSDIVVDVDAHATIAFGPNGQVVGFAAVNRFTGGYSLSEQGKLTWSTGGFATTRKMGPPELMEKERAYLRGLPKTNVAILGKHTLILQSDDSATVLTFEEVGH